jgi:hypothetical protein
MATKLKKLPLPPGLRKAMVSLTKLPADPTIALTAGDWRTCPLNEVTGDTSIVNLSSGQFTIPGGSYLIYINAAASSVNSHQARLYNVTSSSVESSSMPQRVAGGAFVSGTFLSTKLELGAATTFELQQKCDEDGFFATSTASQTGAEKDVHTNIIILKL